MKWVLIGLAILIALVLLMFIVGSLRPRDHVATTVFRVASPDSAVWAQVSALDKAHEWVPDVRGVIRLPDHAGRPAFEEDWGGWKVKTVLAASEPPRRLVKEILPGGAFHGSWTWELAPDGEGTQLTITERGTVPNPLFRAMMMFSDTRKTMRGYAAALAKRLNVAVREKSSGG